MDGSNHGDASNDDDDDDEPGVPYLISNLAVLEMLQPRVEARKGRKSSKQHRHRDWIERRVVEYVATSAATQFQNAANAAALQTALRGKRKSRKSGANSTATSSSTGGFDLTEAESLQILNLSPKEPVEIHLLVEELHDRMTARKQDELLVTLETYRTVRPATENGNHDLDSNTMQNDDNDRKPEATRYGE